MDERAWLTERFEELVVDPKIPVIMISPSRNSVDHDLQVMIDRGGGQGLGCRRR